MAYRPVHASVADGKSKMASKWDKELTEEICFWIRRATGASVPSDDPVSFAEALEDGQTLCNLANKIQPGAIKKINKTKMPFQKMENVGWFVDFITAYGVQQEYIFVTVDLYEKQNVPLVILALRALKDKAAEKGVNF